MKIDNSDLKNETLEHLDQAYVHEAKGELEQALYHCKLALQFAPNLADAYNLRGLVLEQLGQRKQALADYHKAIRLNPDFEEAQQNLIEAKAEMLASQQSLDQLQRARKTALWGMLGYGVGFVVADVVLTLLATQRVTEHMSGVLISSSKYSFDTILVFGAILYALGSGFGAALMGKGSGFNKIRLLVGASALGCGFAYLAATILYQNFLSFSLTVWPDLDSLELVLNIATTVQFAVIGACTGALLGAVQKKWRQVVLSAVAGVIAFGLGSLFARLISEWILFDALISGGLIRLNSALVIAYALRGALVGTTFGALLGLMTKQRNGDVD